ncbi:MULTISPECIES: ATP phosphoribosyltransferase regulatory subunit [Helicobacter]|uniref:ATP phosphoribosyltransferase regulatory subunit n=1 Tax=Helicobacter ibis TaxID=2962633 RepID=A0ABT4VEU1_9HELI|nr:MULTISPECIES: ATP phosphoribosyltransferase regulatory subunit [Helicobacter]MDA3967075.1 ATP phosphoribosyltransferase regulatory subunit [Helicobacter sp. WB40]MDA3969209.1 ATP phosphoribosyltransferase regulatory subunit [Helicobacter ibis]
MILSHEIPQGSKLYFGKSAKIKRDLENLVSNVLNLNGYEEILTPTFSYLQYQRDIQNREAIRISNKHNHQMILRQDSTIDAMRLLTPYLSENLVGKKWFYIQPVFVYPTTEINQIGVENLEDNDILSFIDICVDIFKKINLAPYLQIGSGNIAKICHLEFGVPLEVFKKMDINALIKSDFFLKELLEARDVESLQGLAKKAPKNLQNELNKIIEFGNKIAYKDLIISPLMYPPMEYYDDLFFRFFIDNHTMILGGSYEILKRRALGFGVYTDNVICKLMDL